MLWIFLNTRNTLNFFEYKKYFRSLHRYLVKLYRPTKRYRQKVRQTLSSPPFFLLKRIPAPFLIHNPLFKLLPYPFAFLQNLPIYTCPLFIRLFKSPFYSKHTRFPLLFLAKNAIIPHVILYSTRTYPPLILHNLIFHSPTLSLL